MRLTSKEDLDVVQLWLLERRMERIRWPRLAFTPVLAVLLLLVARVGDRGGWRIWAIAGAMLAAGGIVAMMRVHRRVNPDLPAALSRFGHPLFSFLFIAPLFLATGGFESPVLPFMIPMAFGFGILAPKRVIITWTLVATVLVIGLAVLGARQVIPNLVPPLLGGDFEQPKALLVAKAGCFVLIMVWTAYISSVVRRGFQQIVGDELDARAEILRSHEGHTRELTALTGELAHELKNPLANMKGLVELVRRDSEGRALDRLAVLDGEVNRMQEIIQNVLTFARPGVPLGLEQVDIRSLCLSVLSLHEGLAHTKKVRLSLQCDAPLLTLCDPRKVRQILINLVQNAMEASGEGSQVEIAACRPEDGGVNVEVRDRGTGVSPLVLNRLFESGITTKEGGSGIGLALSRGLALQHGGDLSIRPRDGGGCIALMTLPKAPPTPSMETTA